MGILSALTVGPKAKLSKPESKMVKARGPVSKFFRAAIKRAGVGKLTCVGRYKNLHLDEDGRYR